MKTLVKFNKKRTICGFTFHAGWFGEFSDRGELVKVYAYPWIEFNYFTGFVSWRICWVFNKVESCSWLGDWANFKDVPEAVYNHFNKMADYEDMLYIEGRTA